MSFAEDSAFLSREALLALVTQLQRQVSELQRQLTESSATIEELRTQNAQVAMNWQDRPRPDAEKISRLDVP